jgi:hypothetical protein
LYGSTPGTVLIHYSYESVAAFGQGLDEARRFGGIAQGFPQPLDGVVEAVVEIHEGIGGPDAPLQLLARDRLTGMFQKDLQNLEGLLLQLDLHTVLAEFARTQIKLEVSEPECFAGWGNFLQDRPTL